MSTFSIGPIDWILLFFGLKFETSHKSLKLLNMLFRLNFIITLSHTIYLECCAIIEERHNVYTYAYGVYYATVLMSHQVLRKNKREIQEFVSVCANFSHEIRSKMSRAIQLMVHLWICCLIIGLSSNVLWIIAVGEYMVS